MPYGYPGPPKKSKTPLIVGIVAAVIVVLVAVGVGAFLLLGDDENGSDEGGSERGSDSTSASETTSPEGDVPSEGAVQPEGAPYSFEIPEGFEDASARAEDVGEFQVVYAPVGSTSSSAISVSVVDLGTTDLDQIESGVSGSIERAGRQVTASDRVEVDGRETLRLESEGAGFDAVYHYIPLEDRVIYLYCELAGADAEQVEAGCEQVVESMTID